MKFDQLLQWVGLALISAGAFTVWVWSYWLGLTVTGVLLVTVGALLEHDRRRKVTDVRNLP